MYLQLADGQPGSVAMPNLLKYMLRVPDGQGGFVWVREDQFYHLPDETIMEILETQPHLNTMSGMFDGVKNAFANMKQRKEDKRAMKASEQNLKLQKKEAKIGIKNARANKINAKGEAILEGTYVSPVQGITDTVTGMFAPAPMDTRSFDFPMVTGEATVGVNKWYQNPLTLGAIAIVGLGVVYFATRSRTNK